MMHILRWLSFPPGGERMAKEWVVATDHVWLDGLGEFLARSVSGEWREVATPALVGYVLAQTDDMEQALPIARGVSRFLLEERAGTWLDRQLRRHYHDFDTTDREEIVALALRLLHLDPARDGDRIDLATAELFRFLVDHDEMILDGVTQFLWPEIAQEFDDVVDRAVDEFLIEREYKEFVLLLRRLVTMAKTSVTRAHVFYDEDRFYVEDEYGARLGEDILKEMMSGIPLDADTYDDLLVSLLVTLAPKELIIHQRIPDVEAMRTLQGVFAQHVICCIGCTRCSTGTWRIDNPNEAAYHPSSVQ